MDTNIGEFVTKGLERYPEAQETVIFFCTTVIEVFDRALRDVERDDAFIRADKPNLTKAVGAKWITRYTLGRVAGEFDARVEIGIWWNSDGIDESPIVYANLLDAPEAILRFQPPMHEHVQAHPRSTNRTRLYIAASMPSDLEADARLVLSVLQDGVSRAAATATA